MEDDRGDDDVVKIVGSEEAAGEDAGEPIEP